MAPPAKALETYLQEATRQLYSVDPSAVTVNSVRQHAEEEHDLEKGFFLTPEWKARSKSLITGYVQELLADDSPSSPELKPEKSRKRAVKRSSSDESSPAPAAKRRKRAGATVTSKKSKTKKESSSPALSPLSDADVRPKQDKESDSELSDLDLSEEELKQSETPKKPAANRKSKKEESESELSDLSSSEDKPKPTKRRGRKAKTEESEDDKKGTITKAPTSRSKRKGPVAKTKRAAKHSKVKSDSEDETDKEDKVETNDTLADDKVDEHKSMKAQNSGDEAMPEKQVDKPLVDDSDSSLSSVLDDPPPKKRKGKGAAKEAPKSKPSTAKELTGDEVEIKKLQGQLVKCGVRKIWGIELKKYGSDSKAKIRHLRDMLRGVGMDGRFSEAKAREIKERRELIGELEAVNEMNELWGLEGRGGRASRSNAVRKSTKEESEGDEEDDENDQKPTIDDDDEQEVKATSRVSKRMADLAFLGSDSESE